MYYRTESLVGIPRRFRSTHCLHLEQCKTYNESHTREEYFLSHSLSTSWIVQNLQWVTYHRRVFFESLAVYILNSAKLTVSHIPQKSILWVTRCLHLEQCKTYNESHYRESLAVSILNSAKLTVSHIPEANIFWVTPCLPPSWTLKNLVSHIPEPSIFWVTRCILNSAKLTMSHIPEKSIFWVTAHKPNIYNSTIT